MSISKEVRIGILATVSLVIFFLGFYFLKGNDLFSNDKEYYCYYNDVDGLPNSANVLVRGLVVGHITSQSLSSEKGVKVTIAIRKDVRIPQGTVATIVSDGLLGGKLVRLDLGTSPIEAESRTVLGAREEVGLVDNLSDQITPLMKSLRMTVTALDTVIAGVNAIVGDGNKKGISATINSLNVTADNLAKITNSLSNEGAEIKDILHNANSITGSLAKSNDTIKRVLSNLNTVTRQLANAPIQKTIAELQSTSTELNGVMTKINRGDGTMGMIVNNKDLYNNLNSTMKSLDQLLADLKAHPSKYVNISVFGGKKKQ